MAHRLRPVAFFILIGIMLVFAVQNIADVEVQFLIWSFVLPRAILVIVVFALGILIGWILHSLRVRKRPADSAEQPPDVAGGTPTQGGLGRTHPSA